MRVAAEEFLEVRDGLYFWEAYDPSVKAELSCCAHRTDQGLVLIDPIEMVPAAWDELFDVSGHRPIGILLTSGNHRRAAPELRARFDVPIFAHHEAVPELDFLVDSEISEASTILSVFRSLVLPGGAPGEVAYLCENIAHLGDALIHLPSTGLQILPEKYCSDAKTLRHSLLGLLAEPLEIFTFAHGLPVVNKVHERLSQLLL